MTGSNASMTTMRGGAPLPGPTIEVLDDLKEVRSDLYRTEVNLIAEVHKVDKGVARLGAEFVSFKWLLGAILATTLAGIFGSGYWAGSDAARVAALERRLDRLDRLDARLERIEAALARPAGPPAPTSPPAPTPGR